MGTSWKCYQLRDRKLKIPSLLRFIQHRETSKKIRKKVGLWALSALVSIIFKIYSNVPKGHIGLSE